MTHFRTQEISQTPRGWHVRTVRAGEHQVRIAFPPGSRHRGAGRVVEILHPKENPSCEDGSCAANPAELVILGNPAGEPRVETYSFATRRAGHIRQATRVVFPDGRKVEFIERLPKAKAIAQAKEQLAKGNPDGEEIAETEQAVQLYREFHGKDPKEIIEAQRSTAMRLDYVALGELLGVAPYVEGLRIPSPEHWDDGGYPVLKFDGVKLASNAAGTQLYAIGGEQDLADVLDEFGADPTKDVLDLGEIAYVTYRARKSLNNFEETEWTHVFDEPRPVLGFDQLKREIFFAGGRYEVNAPGIEH